MAFEGILTNGVTEILNKLLPVVAQEIRLSWGLKDDLRKLQTTIEMILAVVADAERRQVTEEAVRLWLRWLKDVAYDAEDAIDEFSYKTMHRLVKGNNLKHKACDLVCGTNPLTFRFKMARKVKHINQRFDEITKDMSRFHLQTTPDSNTAILPGESIEQWSRQTASYINESDIIGREDDMKKIIDMLTKVIIPSSTGNPEKVPVVSIVGMGGLGKTSLAQLVYNDELVNTYFELTIWVHVSEYFDVEKILTKIMESSTQKKFDSLSNFDVLVRKVREQLSGKRYLLVLDDLWNENAEQWERLYTSLLVGAQGSKILTTTRKRQVAEVVKGSISPYFLEKLQADECWSIMERKAFSPGGALKIPAMINIGKEIANKCSGLPLAAKFLGSLMHSKNSESNWLSIRDNDMWNTPESRIITILKLSYDNLSPHLKRCFSYCSIFPKYWEFNKQTIIQLWMAEGFLQPSIRGNDFSFEDIGDEYVESLMWSSFFDGVEKNELDEVMTFKMHDLVHDLAQAVVGNHECSIVKVTDQVENSFDVRRCNLIMDKKLPPGFLKTISNTKKLRTIIVLEPSYWLDLRKLSSKHLRILHLGHPAIACSMIRYATSKLRQLRYFRVTSLVMKNTCAHNLFGDYSLSRLYNLQTLVLSRCRFVQNRVKEIGSLKHLRHLDISFSDIEELPDSVASLHNLRTLDLNHCQNFIIFPESVTGFKCLRFLDMSFTSIGKIPDFVTSLRNLQTLDVNTCMKLKMLPEYVGDLKNLSFFNFKNCPLLEALPKDFGSLTQLRYLNLDGTAIKVLHESCGNLHNLEYVDLSKCELPKNVTSWIKLRKFYYESLGTPMGIRELVWLKELTYQVRVKFINEAGCNDGIEELANLNSLEVLGIGDLQNVKDPTDGERANLKGKKNLRKLHLRWGKIEEDLGMKACNHLQVIAALQPPTSLRNLYIDNFMGWEFPTWMRVPSGLPNLELLLLNNCRGIKQLPSVIGKLPRLRNLDLHGMSLKSLDIDGFPSLIKLRLGDTVLLEELHYSYPCLQELVISGCSSLTEIPSFPSLMILLLQKINPKLLCSIGRSQKSLTTLALNNIDDLMYFPIRILQNNSNLQDLQIVNCTKFEGFGANIDENENAVPQYSPKLYMSSLQSLELADCPVLKFFNLPDLRGWTSLRKLTIWNCPQVKESLTYDLKSLSFLRELYVDFIQRDYQQQLGDPSTPNDLINLMHYK